MKSIDLRKQKIRELKLAITKSNEGMVERIVAAKTEEEKAALKDAIAVSKAERQAMEGEIKLLRLNKLSSSAFQWHPHKGGNRSQAKQLRHSRRRKRPTNYARKSKR